MTAGRALGAVLLWGITFAFVGGLVGGTLGTVAPDYYRSVFRDGHSPDFNPFQVGIGLGVTQGLASGVAIALGVLAVLAWRDARSGTGSAADPFKQGVRRPPRWSWLALWGVATLLSVVIFSTIAFVLGGIVGQQQLYQTWTDRKLQRITGILDSGEFPNVQSEYSSAAQVFLIGNVQNSEVRSALRSELALAFGTDEADDMIRLVDVGE